MTVQNVRAPGATSIITNTVSGAPTKFYGTMGAPHTFTDPQTGETITVISEATAVDFAGSIVSGHVEIDAIAPGYTDTRGSLVGDIVIVRPITEWANNLYNILSQAHNDNGSLKNSAVTYNANIFDHIASGAVLAGLGYGATLTASLSAGTCYINGNLQTIAAVATRTYTASKDTYVDALYNANGTATIVYTEVANNAASPALAANSIRLGIVVTGAANIAAAGSINQGQEDRVLPIAASIPYQVTDSLGNLINPRDPQRRLLGQRRRSASFSTTSGTPVQIPELSVPVIVPAGRKVRVIARSPFLYNTTGSARADLSVFDGAIGGILVAVNPQPQSLGTGAGGGYADSGAITPSTASKTYNGTANTGGGGTAVVDVLGAVYSELRVELM